MNSFGPSKACAMLEGSKAFSKKVMKDNNIPTAEYESFTEYDKAAEYLKKTSYPVVIKASGLAAGKGVVLPDESEKSSVLRQIMVDHLFGSAGDEVIIEERLEGSECSLLLFCDGERAIPMPISQDHKRVNDNDEGPNTGYVFYYYFIFFFLLLLLSIIISFSSFISLVLLLFFFLLLLYIYSGMGAYAPTPLVTPIMVEKMMKTIVEPTLKAMKDHGHPYKGVLYCGLMVTPNGDIKVLEYNCRFGDPETEVILPLLKSDLYDIMVACCKGELDKINIEWKNEYCCTVIACSGGYPSNNYKKGLTITGVERANNINNNSIVFHAGTKLDGEFLLTSGGRVLAVTALGKTLRQAISHSYVNMNYIRFDHLHYRHDIGKKALDMPIRIGIIGSTNGTDMVAIHDAIENGKLHATVGVVVSNKSPKENNILVKAKNYGYNNEYVPCAKGTDRSVYDAKVSEVLDRYGCQLICLIGYMRIVSPEFCNKWENKCINVHPSLLPDFAGGMDLNVHEEVIKAQKKESGCTIHMVTAEVDGGAYLLQKKCEVTSSETPESLKNKVQQLEGEAFIEVINKFWNGDYDNIDNTVSYSAAGVNIDAGNTLVNKIKSVCKSTSRPGADVNLGGFGGLFDLKSAGYEGDDTILVATDDGVGTKLKIAIDCNIHNTVGIDLVAMSVNDLIVQGAEPLFFEDYFATGKLEVNVAAEVVTGIAEGCKQANCALIGGETAEMPQMYKEGDYDLAGFSVGAVKRSQILPKPTNIGDVVIGVASTGVHSNGFSMVRFLIEKAGLNYNDKCPYDNTKTIGQQLLTPTKIYVRSLNKAIKTNKVIALAHITGGGLTENIPRVLSDETVCVLDPKSWNILPVFKWLYSLAHIEESDFIRTFNCGIGMIVVCKPGDADEIMKILREEGETVSVIGKIIKREGNEEQVKYTSKFFE